VGKRKSSKEELVLLLLALFRMRMFKNLSLGCLTLVAVAGTLLTW